MRDLLLLAIHLLVTLAKLLHPTGIRAVAAESLLLNHQLLINDRSRHRAPNPTSLGRCVLELTTLFVAHRRIPILLRSHWFMVVMNVFTRRLIGFGVEPAYIDGISVCRMFNHATAGQTLPKHASTDHEPLFRFPRWLANLRVLEIEEIKSIPYTPVSHPFMARLIGTIRREYLDHLLFWNVVDLTRKVDEP